MNDTCVTLVQMSGAGKKKCEDVTDKISGGLGKGLHQYKERSKMISLQQTFSKRESIMSTPLL